MNALKTKIPQHLLRFHAPASVESPDCVTPGPPFLFGRVCFEMICPFEYKLYQRETFSQNIPQWLNVKSKSNAVLNDVYAQIRWSKGTGEKK